MILNVGFFKNSIFDKWDFNVIEWSKIERHFED